MTELTASGGVLAPIVKAAGRIVTSFDRVARAGWLAGIGILVPILIWIWPVSAVGSVGVVLLALVLALPGTVIYLVGRALASVAKLPLSIVSQATAVSQATTSQATTSETPSLRLNGGLRSIWSVGRYLMGIRGRLWEMRDELAAAGVLMRLASLPVLISILVAVLAIGLMIPSAALAILVMAITR